MGASSIEDVLFPGIDVRLEGAACATGVNRSMMAIRSGSSPPCGMRR